MFQLNVIKMYLWKIWRNVKVETDFLVCGEGVGVGLGDEKLESVTLSLQEKHTL